MNRLLLGYNPDLDLFDGLPRAQSGRRRAAAMPASLQADNTELAVELLDAVGTPRLSALLGRLVRAAAGASGGRAGEAVMGELVGLLQGAVRQALPAGTRPEGAAASRASRFFGIELEGLSPEDQEFEAARRFVQLAAEAARQAALAPPRLQPAAAARLGAAGAAKRYAPGWLSSPAQATATAVARPAESSARSGHRTHRIHDVIELNP